MTTEPRFSPDQLAAIARRFWPKVDRSGDGCWEWQASRNAAGYGKFGIDYRTWSAPRVAWVLANGPITGGLWLLHHCDNPSCVKTEPDALYPAGHLFLGTHADNMADMAGKGRAAVDGKATGDRNVMHLHPERASHGDEHWTRQRPEHLARGDRNGARLHPDRLARGDRNGARTKPETRARGEHNGSSKLTPEKVVQIRTFAAAGLTQPAIGRLFGIHDDTVGRIVRRKSWGHVA